MTAEIKEFARVVRKIPSWADSIADDTTRMFWIRLLLQSRLKSFRTLNTVSVVFDSELKAQEFLKLVRHSKVEGMM